MTVSKGLCSQHSPNMHHKNIAILAPAWYYSSGWFPGLMMRISVSLTDGDSENLLLCRRPGEAGCAQVLSNGLGSADESSSFSSSRDMMLLSLRIIDFPWPESRTAALHALETRLLTLRTFINTPSPNWPFWDASPTAGNDRGVKLVIGMQNNEESLTRGPRGSREKLR